PSSALVVGVMIGLANLSFSFKPSGRLTPQISLLPDLYSLQAWPVRYPLITISTLKGSHFLPIVTVGWGVAITQLGTMSSVAFKKVAAIWFNTCPLYGRGWGRTTSKAEILSVATMAILSSKE